MAGETGLGKNRPDVPIELNPLWKLKRGVALSIHRRDRHSDRQQKTPQDESNTLLNGRHHWRTSVAVRLFQDHRPKASQSERSSRSRTRRPCQSSGRACLLKRPPPTAAAIQSRWGESPREPILYPEGIKETLASFQDFDMGSRGLSPHQLFGFLRGNNTFVAIDNLED